MGVFIDRLLWSWAAIPLGLLSLASVKNAHYALAAQVPLSIWAALVLARLGEGLRRRGWEKGTVMRMARAGFMMLALGYGLGLWLLTPWLNRRSVEWAFYESSGRLLSPDIPIALLYDDWDRSPYENPFGRIPHDLAIRLFYLGRPACWHFGIGSLATCDHCIGGCLPDASRSKATVSPVHPTRSVCCVIGRERDMPALQRFGQVEVVAHGPSLRRDRTYRLFRITRNFREDYTAGPERLRVTY